MDWFRFYSETRNDKKLEKLSEIMGEKFANSLGIWTVFLCFSGESPTRGKLFIAENIPVSTSDLRRATGYRNIEKWIDEMVKLNLIYIENGAICITKWEKRQFKSDDNYERVKRFRNVSETEKKRFSIPLDETIMKRKRNDTDTDTDTDTDIIVDTIVDSSTGYEDGFTSPQQQNGNGKKSLPAHLKNHELMLSPWAVVAREFKSAFTASRSARFPVTTLVPQLQAEFDGICKPENVRKMIKKIASNGVNDCEISEIQARHAEIVKTENKPREPTLKEQMEETMRLQELRRKEIAKKKESEG